MMFIFMATGGLMITAQTKPFAKDVGIASTIVILAVTVDRISNGLGRISWGWVSDKIGRETTMAIAFALNAAFLFLMPIWGHNGIMFVLSVFFIMFTWGEIYSLFPPATADRFGTTYAASNYGVVYSAKGIGGILAGYVAAVLVQKTGWTVVFDAAAAMALLSAIGALVLRRMSKPVLPETRISGGIATKA